MEDKKYNYNCYTTLSNISKNSSALKGFVDAVNSIEALSKEIAQQEGESDYWKCSGSRKTSTKST